VTQASVYCSVLGQTEIRTEGIRLTPEAERQFALALYFCVNAGREVGRDELAELFRAGKSVGGARRSLRQALYRLREVGVPARSGANGIVLDERLVESDYAPVIAEGASASAYVSMRGAAVLPGYTPHISTEFSRWVEDVRDHIAGRLRRGLVRVIAELRDSGRVADLEILARHCLTIDPLNETATLALARAVALSGGVAEAMRMLDRYEREVGHRVEACESVRILKSRVSELGSTWSPGFPRRVPLVGREVEIERLLVALVDAMRGSPRCVSLVGEGGIGKTAIVEEFLRMAELRDATTIRILCQNSDRERPLSAVCEIVTQLLPMPGALGSSPESLANLRPLVSYHATPPERAHEHTDPFADRRRLLDATLDLIDAVAEERPLVVLIDDAHWIDGESLRMLSTASRSSATRRLLLLACGRAQTSDSGGPSLLLDAGNGEVLSIRPLSETASRRLVGALLQSVDAAVALERTEDLLRLAGGNPLFIVELARRIRERPYETLPVNLNALLDARIQARSSLGLTVVQACAVLGKHATMDRLERVLELPAFQLVTAVNELEVYALVAVEGQHIHCRHELIAAATERSITQGVRMILQKSTAAVLEADALVEGDPALLWQSAHYWEATHLLGDARRVLEQLGDYLLGIGSATDAVQALERAGDYCDTDSQRMRLLGKLLIAQRIAWDWKAILQTVKARKDLANGNEAVGCDPDADSLLYFEALFRTQDPDSVLRLIIDELRSKELSRDRLLALCQMGLVVADNALDAPSAHEVHAALARFDEESLRSDRRALAAGLVFHTTFGALPEALNVGEKIRASMPPIAAAGVHELQLLRWSAVPLVYAGEFDRASRVLTEAYEVARAQKLNREAFAACEWSVEMNLVRSGTEAAHVWLRCAEASRPAGDNAIYDAIQNMNSALIALWEGRLHEAESFIEAMDPYIRSVPDGRARLRYMGLRLATLAALGVSVSRGELDHLLRLLARSWNFGDQDVGACAAVHLLRRAGEFELSRRVLAEYRSLRRERYPIPELLVTSFLET
jgi:DNA-binding SARP family transcriptional activator